MRALLLEWDSSTGLRAGGINPKDPALQCHGWQNMDVIPHIELRIVEDSRSLDEYIGLAGITILEGPEEINTAIDINFKAKYSVNDEFLYNEHFKQVNNPNTIIDISSLPDDRTERLKILKETYGIKGIIKKDPLKV